MLGCVFNLRPPQQFFNPRLKNYQVTYPFWQWSLSKQWQKYMLVGGLLTFEPALTLDKSILHKWLLCFIREKNLLQFVWLHFITKLLLLPAFGHWNNKFFTLEFKNMAKWIMVWPKDRALGQRTALRNFVQYSCDMTSIYVKMWLKI